MKWYLVLVVCGLSGVAGCTTLPASGPRTVASLPAVNQAQGIQHVVVNVTPDILAYLPHGGGGGGFSRFRGGGGPSETQIGVGDIIGITIFEAGSGGLFIPAEAGSRSGNFVALPDQQVDRDGNISVPYAGNIRVVGMTPTAIQNTIQQRLASRAIEPQAVVSIRSQTSSQVSVLGDVTAPSKFQLNPKGERILDVIARAGGPRYPGYETYVTLQRGSRKATMFFETIVQEPSSNVFVRPGDTVYVYRDQQAFMAFGAAGINGRFPFEAESISLTDALGKAGGLIDNRANPGAVLVYRLESRKVAKKLGIEVDRWGEAETIPVIYQFNLAEQSGFFLASSFPVLNKDVIYIGNAAAVEFLKLIDVIGTTASATVATREAVK